MTSGGTVVVRYESERAFHDSLAESGGHRAADRFSWYPGSAHAQIFLARSQAWSERLAIV